MLHHDHGLGISEHFIASEGNRYSQIGQELYAITHSTNLLSMMGWSWLVMLVAMMTPLLADPLRHLWVRSLPRRRWIAIVLFLIGYVAIWMLAGMVLMLSTVLLRIVVGDDKWLVVLGLALALAIAWQSSPWKQACLNHCHWTPRLSPFGLAANWDCLRYGIVNGLWCVGACWALMLLPLAAIHAYLPLMAATSSILVVDRYRPARPARWRVPLVERELEKLSEMSI
jgi:predicted metal-binding membrane protein